MKFELGEWIPFYENYHKYNNNQNHHNYED